MADVSSYKVYGTLPTIGEEQVKKLIEQSESGALPEVTAEDNGKVLTVVDGEWDKANAGGGGGGGGVLVITATGEESEGVLAMTLDKTWQEIYDAPFAVIDLAQALSDVPQKKMVTTVMEVSHENGEGTLYYVSIDGAYLGQEVVSFTSETASGYPAVVLSDGD